MSNIQIDSLENPIFKARDVLKDNKRDLLKIRFRKDWYDFETIKEAFPESFSKLFIDGYEHNYTELDSITEAIERKLIIVFLKKP